MPRPSIAIVDAPVTAPESATDSPADHDRVLHFVKRGDHPRALCGAIVRDSWDPTTTSRGRDTCTTCQRIASELMRNGKAWR